jgi:hypothetical protein
VKDYVDTGLNTKQDALTLTTTGTSGAATLVGDTLNIPQYGGGGGGFNALVSMGSGNIYSNIPIGAGNTNVNITSDTIVLIPFIPAQSFTTSNLFINVTVLGVGANTRILLYSHSATNGLPNTKLYESANLDCSTIGIKTATTSQTFTAGTIYWLGYYANSSIPSVSGALVASLLQIGVTSSMNQYTSITRATTFGSAPSTWVVSGSNRISTSAIRIGLTIA